MTPPKGRGLNILVAAKLHENQIERHLELLERLDDVERIIVVRHSPLPERLSKLENVSFAGGSVPLGAFRMLRKVDEVLARERIDWVLGLNPVPWGSVAQVAARRRGIRTCLSLIGKDFLQIQTQWGRPFLAAVRRATHVTVTGPRMTEVLVARGVRPERISVLPHSVDTGRFRPRDIDPRYDVVSVGQLIERKRMHVLVEAVRLLRERGLRLRVGILGRGPEQAHLEAQIATAGLDGQVELLPYRDDVETVLASSRIFCLVSAWEGVPFALMEAMATGLVPVVTEVGSIGDWVSEGVNGRVVPIDDPSRLARVLEELLLDDGLELSALRARVIEGRSRLSFDTGVEVWRGILTRPT